jgi:hypothetical protein
MKKISLLALILMTVALTGCGGKDGGSKGSSSINSLQAGQPFTKDGYYNTQTQALEMDGITYPPSQQYAQAMNAAIQQAQQQQVQPILVNGVYKFKARISGVSNGTGVAYNTGYNPYNTSYNQYNQATFSLTSVQFYR